MQKHKVDKMSNNGAKLLRVRSLQDNEVARAKHGFSHVLYIALLRPEQVVTAPAVSLTMSLDGREADAAGNLAYRGGRIEQICVQDSLA